ncbi:MAG: hypothetical protein ACW98X_24405, partial [Promethearchaeota archaeon]
MAKHIKTSKKCLKLRGCPVDTQINTEIYNGMLIEIDCLKKSVQTQLDKIKELGIEDSKKDNVLLKNNILIAELKAKLSVHENINKSNCSVTNNTVNNNNNIIISNLDILENPDKLRMLIEEHYSTDYFKGGQQGVAKFSNDHLITDDRGNKMYICTDVSRNSFKYKNSSGELIKDPNCAQLVNSMLD